MSLLIRKQLTDRARDFNIIMDDVAITELSFGKDYSAAGGFLCFSLIADFVSKILEFFKNEVDEFKSQ